MKLYQILNNYLLRNFPNIWITRIHLFIPIGLAMFCLIFGLNTWIGYDLNTPLPKGESSVFLMIIPVLIYMVYWFVFQARYNVEKSGGKLTLVQDFVNYFSYFLMFFVAFTIIMAIPLSNNYKVANAITKSDLNQDVKLLNTGYGVFHLNYDIQETNNTYSFNYVNDYQALGRYYVNNNKSNEKLSITHAQFSELAQNYIQTYNKYADDYGQIKLSTSQLVALAFTNDNLPKDHRWRKSVDYKINEINKLQNNGWYKEFMEVEVFMVLGGFLAMLALLVWIFKQIFWKHYVFGLVAMLLTPLFIAIIGLLFFEIFRFDESFAFALVFLTYAIFSIKIIISVNSKQRNNSAIVMAMYLQLALPFLPLLILTSSNSHFQYLNDNISTIYIVSWGVGLISIAVFKYVYRRLSILPSKK